MLNHKFKFYVPGTNGGVIPDRALQNRMADKVLEEFGTMFGGSTVTEAQGIWKNNVGILVRERIVLVESFTDEINADRHYEDVFALAAMVAAQMGQESIALEVDDVLNLVPPHKVEKVALAA